MQASPTPVDEKAQAFVGRTFRRQVHNKLPAGQLKAWACAQHQRANAALWQHTTRIQSIPIQPDQDLVHCLRTSIGGIGRTPITSLFAHHVIYMDHAITVNELPKRLKLPHPESSSVHHRLAPRHCCSSYGAGYDNAPATFPACVLSRLRRSADPVPH